MTKKIENTLWFSTKDAAEKYAANYREQWYGHSGIASVRYDATKQMWMVQLTRWDTCD